MCRSSFFNRFPRLFCVLQPYLCSSRSYALFGNFQTVCEWVKKRLNCSSACSILKSKACLGLSSPFVKNWWKTKQNVSRWKTHATVHILLPFSPFSKKRIKIGKKRTRNGEEEDKWWRMQGICKSGCIKNGPKIGIKRPKIKLIEPKINLCKPEKTPK